MSTFNLSGASKLGLTPTRQENGKSSLQFTQMPFNVKTLSAFDSTHYWCVQGSTLKFLSIGTIFKIRSLRGLNTFAFDPVQFQDLQHFYPRQLANSATHTLTISQTNVGGHVWPKFKNIALHLASVGDAFVTTPTPLTASNSFSFTPSNSLNALRNLHQTSSFTFSHANTTTRSNGYKGTSNFAFTSEGDSIRIPNPKDQSNVSFSQTSSVGLVKSLTATHAVSFINGGFGLVY